MELNITEFFNNAAPMDYSASVAEIGNDAGKATWSAACDDSCDYMILDTDEKREAMRQWVKGFGAWDDAEIAAWSDVELNGLLLQFIAGDMREAGLYPGMTDDDWYAYQEASEAGQVSGRIFGGPLTVDNDGQVYIYIGD